MVPWRAFVELANRGRVDIDRTNAAQRDQAGGRRAVRAMPGAAKKNGYRAVHPILRVPSARRSGSAGMVPSRGAATGEGADGFDRSANRSGHRARARAYSTAGLLRESFPDRHGNAAVLPPGSVVGEPADSRRTGELLRRRSNCGLRRRRELRASAYADGRMADGAGLDDGGQSQPARRAGDAATRMEWNRRKNSRGGASREFRLLGGSAAPGRQEQGSSSVIVVTPEAAPSKERAAQAAKPAPAVQPAPKPQPNPASEPQTANDGKKQSYMDAMAAAGVKITDVDELISLKIQGVTPEYIKGMHDLGLQPNAEELIGMKVQGITPEYVREMRKFDSNASIDDLIGMKVQGITPEYVREFHDLGLQPSADELIGLKVQGVTPDYVKEMRATGLKPNTDELIGMKVQGITPEYVRSTQAAGFKDLDCDELIGAKVQGVTPEFIEKARKHGFQNLTLDKLIALKHADIL